MDHNRPPPNPLFTLKRTPPPAPLSGTDHNAYMQIVQGAWTTGLPALQRVVDLDIVQWTSLLFRWLNPHDETREEAGKQLVEALEQIVEHLDPSYDEGFERVEERPTTAIPAFLCAIQMGFEPAPAEKPRPAAPAALELVPSRPKHRRPRQPHQRILIGVDEKTSTSLGKYCLYSDEQLLKAHHLTQTGRYRLVDIARKLRMNASYISKLSKGENKRLTRLLEQVAKQADEPPPDDGEAAPAAE